MRSSLESSFETVKTLTSNASGILGTSADASEARQAFIEKRKPIFRGVWHINSVNIINYIQINNLMSDLEPKKNNGLQTDSNQL